MSLRILITGAAGMLGTTLVARLQDKFEVYATDILNFAENPAKNYLNFDLLSKTYDVLIDWARPGIIIHCAAITNVDFCEKHPEKAMVVNAQSVKKFFQSKTKAKMIFISSDAVFPDGLHLAAENDRTEPINIYGKSKEAGEQTVKDSDGTHLALRTTIVGKNMNPSSKGFLEWIIDSVKEGHEIILFEDVFFTPITTWHLADELEWVINNFISGIIHIAGSEPISKYEFGFQVCKGLKLDTSLIKRGKLNNIVFNAERSNDQTLDSGYFESISGRALPSMEETVKNIGQHF